MKRYKRNQIEEAVAEIIGGNVAPSRIKRLLDLDRDWGRDRRSTDAAKANYAFFTDNPPGQGADVWFSEYDALAVVLGLRMLQSEWPQAHVVRALRIVRQDLGGQYPSIVGKSRNPADLQRPKETAKPGDLASPIAEPVFLAITSAKKDENHPLNAGICQSQREVFEFWTRVGRAGTTITVIDVTAVVAELLPSLAKTEPRNRGRTS